MKHLLKGWLSIFLVLVMLLSALPVSAATQENDFYIQITPSVKDACVGDVVEYTVIAMGSDIAALEFKLLFPAGPRYVAGSGKVPDGLAASLGWAETDWTEESMKWTGYNDVGADFPTGTVILTFSATVEAEGNHVLGIMNLRPYNGNYQEVTPTMYVSSVTATPAKPTKVTGLKAADIQQTSFNLTWDAIEGATKYWVYVDGALLSSTTGSSLAVTKRTPGTTYELKVTARLSDGTILSLADAEALTVTTTVVEVTAPPATAAADVTAITLTWDAQNCAKSWIYLGTSADSLSLLRSCTGGSYTLTGLKSDTTYYIRLSHSIGGKVIMSDEILEVKTLAVQNPTKITGLKAADIQQTSFTVSWDAIEGATKYWVYVNDALLRSTTDSSVVVTQRTAGTAYGVKIIGCLADGTVLKLADAETLTVKTLEDMIAAPGVTATAGPGSVTLQWNADNCTKSWIYIGTSPDNMALLRSCTGGTYTVTGLEGNTKYYIRLSHYINNKMIHSDEILEVVTADKIDLSVTARLSGSDLTLDWAANGNSYKYWITVVKDGKSLIYSTKDTTFTVTDFDPATCTVSIRGINSNGTYNYDPVVV